MFKELLINFFQTITLKKTADKAVAEATEKKEKNDLLEIQVERYKLILKVYSDLIEAKQAKLTFSEIDAVEVYNLVVAQDVDTTLDEIILAVNAVMKL